jgi:hypothetical protein
MYKILLTSRNLSSHIRQSPKIHFGNYAPSKQPKISSYCQIYQYNDNNESEYKSGNITITPEMIKFVMDELLVEEYYNYSFKLIIFADNSYRLFVEISEIIGGRILAEGENYLADFEFENENWQLIHVSKNGYRYWKWGEVYNETKDDNSPKTDGGYYNLSEIMKVKGDSIEYPIVAKRLEHYK